MRNTIKRAATALVVAVAFAGAVAPAAGAQTKGCCTYDVDAHQRFVFAMFRNNTTDVYSAFEDGGLQRLSSWSEYEGQPSFNRNRDKVAYVADYFGRRAIWLMQIGSGTSEIVVPIAGYTDKAPALSPGGTKIAFTSNRSGSWQIWTADTDGTPDLRRLTSYGQNTEPTWSPDGSMIAFTTTQFTGANEVAVMSAAGGAAERVSFGGGQEATWSPWSTAQNHGELAYAVKPTGSARWQIHRQFVDAANVPVVIANLSVDATDPTWSPDGKRILFSTSGGYGPLYSADANGSGNLRLVMSNNGGWIGSAHWGYPITQSVA